MIIHTARTTRRPSKGATRRASEPRPEAPLRPAWPSDALVAVDTVSSFPLDGPVDVLRRARALMVPAGESDRAADADLYHLRTQTPQDS